MVRYVTLLLKITFVSSMIESTCYTSCDVSVTVCAQLIFIIELYHINSVG